MEKAFSGFRLVWKLRNCLFIFLLLPEKDWDFFTFRTHARTHKTRPKVEITEMTKKRDIRRLVPTFVSDESLVTQHHNANQLIFWLRSCYTAVKCAVYNGNLVSAGRLNRRFSGRNGGQIAKG